MQADFEPTEIGEIPEDWQVVNLKDIVREFKNGFASGRRDDRGIVQIRMNNVTTDGKVTLNRYLKVPVQGDIQNLLLRSGDLLFNNTNSIDLVGKSAIFEGAPFPCTFSNHFTRIRADETKVVPRWILYHLLVLWKRRRFETLAIRHVGQSAVHVDELSRMNIPLPSLAEQREIVTVLSTVDDAIQKTDEIIAKTQQLKKGLMQQLLTRGIGHTKFRQTEIGKIPEEWKVLSISEMGEKDRPAVKTGPFGTQLKTEHFRATGVPVLNIASLGDGKVEASGLFYVSEDKARELAEYRVRPGDLVFSRVAEVGRSIVVPPEADGWIISSNLFRISTALDLFHPGFLMFSLTGSPLVTKQVFMLTADAGREIVNSTVLGSIRFPIPPLDEQKRIAAIIQTVQSKVETEITHRKELEKLRRGLMQVLLTGKLRVKVT